MDSLVLIGHHRPSPAPPPPSQAVANGNGGQFQQRLPTSSSANFNFFFTSTSAEPDDSSSSISSSTSPNPIGLELADEELALLEQLRQMSPELCRQGLLNRFEELANQLAAGWKYHVANTDGVKEAWSRFQDFYQNVCSYTEGKMQDGN
jgi:hypothetical protein